MGHTVRRARCSVALALALLTTLFTGTVALRPVEASIPQKAIIWTVNDTDKTITVLVRLEIYTGCDKCPSPANTDLADKIKAQIKDVWNGVLEHYRYRCYDLIFDVDIKVGTDRFHIEDNRVGVRIDNSPVPVRSEVNGVGGSKSVWKSNDPVDKWVPTNDWLFPTTWAVDQAGDHGTRYAHEYGHIIGLQDSYEDVVDPSDSSKTISVTYPDAPDDLMGASRAPDLAQSTINRVVERSPVDRKKLKCWTLELEVNIAIVGNDVEAASVIYGSIPLKSVPVEGRVDKTQLVGANGGGLIWATTGGPIVACGETVMFGNGVARGYVPSGQLGATAAEIRIHFAVDPAGISEQLVLPACRKDPQFSIPTQFWLPYFIGSHEADAAPGGGIDITGWTLTGADLTNGGVLATRTYTESCAGGCTGESTFKLIATPMD